MVQERFGIYLNTKTRKAIRINSPYWIPEGEGWVFLSPEVNIGLLEIRKLAKEMGLLAEPDEVAWSDWSEVPRRH